MTRTLAMLTAAAGLALVSASGFAQPLPPPLPALTAKQSAAVDERMDAYRAEVDARVARGEITADEADRLIKWREWQVARQVAGHAPLTWVEPPYPRDAEAYPDEPPASANYPDYPDGHYAPAPVPYYYAPAPYYMPYPRYPVPYYWGPRPWGYWGGAYWGGSICTSGFGRHFGMRICF